MARPRHEYARRLVSDVAEGPAKAVRFACPQCGNGVPKDPSGTWCELCNWNVDPKGASDSPKRQRARTRASRRARRLYGAALEGRRGAVSANVARIGSYMLSGAVLAACPALLALLAWLWTLGVGIGTVGTIFLLPLAVAARPRVRRVPRDVVVVRKAEAPTLYRLVDQISDELNTRKVEACALDFSYNARTSSIGVARHRMIVIGLPLWDSLEPQEKVALLGHEIGHDASRDLVHSAITFSALQSLRDMHRILRPPARFQDRAEEAIAAAIMAGFAGLLRALIRLQISLAVRTRPGAEYAADASAVQVASSSAVVALLEKLLLKDVAQAKAVAAATRCQEGVWREIQRSIGETSDRERERLRRVAELRHSTVDATHPPTTWRIKIARTRPATAARVVLSHGMSEQLDRELSGARAGVLSLLRSDATPGARRSLRARRLLMTDMEG